MIYLTCALNEGNKRVTNIAEILTWKALKQCKVIVEEWRTSEMC